MSLQDTLGVKEETVEETVNEEVVNETTTESATEESTTEETTAEKALWEEFEFSNKDEFVNHYKEIQIYYFYLYIRYLHI